MISLSSGLTILPGICKFWPVLKMPRLDSDSRNQIIGMLQSGISQRDAARRFNVHVSTISRLNQRFLVTGSTKDRPRPGQPRVTTQRQDVFIRQRHLRNRFVTGSFQPVEPSLGDTEGTLVVLLWPGDSNNLESVYETIQGPDIDETSLTY